MRYGGPIPEWNDSRPGLWGSHDIMGSALRQLAGDYHRSSDPLEDRQVQHDEAHSSLENAETATAADRRIFPRRGARGPVSVARVAPGDLSSRGPERLIRETGISGELLDLSRNGLALALLHQLAADDRIFVRLCPPSGGTPVDCFARVIRTTEIADGFWKIVAQFERPLGFEEAYQLFDRELDLGG